MKCFVLISVGVLTASFLYAGIPSQLPVSDTEHLLVNPQLRAGLPHFFAKVGAGIPVTVAYLGGSITAASGGWRDQTTAWLHQHFKTEKITQINAGVGGTGSDLGVFRLHKDVLVYTPDLVFVEFAVNDHGKSPEIVHRAMEGIVRQIRKANPQTDVCFVYTLMVDMVPTIDQGKLTRTMAAMEEIAGHYKLPSVFLASDVMQAYRQGTLIFRGDSTEYSARIVFSKDGVHPYPQTGHRLYTKSLIRALMAMERAGGRESLPRLPDAFDASNWEDAHMVSPAMLTKEGHWEQIGGKDTIVAAHLRQIFPDLLRGSSMVRPIATLMFTGRAVGLYDIVGPGTGQMDVLVDGKLIKTKLRFDKYSTYYRAQYFLLPDLQTGQHTVNFRVSSQTFDKLTILKDNAPSASYGQPYHSFDAYIGYVLLLGEPIQSASD